MRKHIFRSILVILSLIFGCWEIVQADFNEGLVAYYPFDGHTNDKSGNGHDGIPSHSIDYVEGILQQAVRFDNVNDLIEIPENADMRISYYTISFWVKAGSQDGIVSIFSCRPHKSNTASGFEILVNTNGEISLTQMTRPTGNWGTHTNVSVTDNLWHHITFTFDGTIVRVYLDGELNNEFDCRSVSHDYFPGPIYWTTPYHDFWFGQTTSGHDYATFRGIIDEFRLYNRVLSESEIRQLYDIRDNYRCDDSYTEEDLDNARQEGYDSGYLAGKQYCINNPSACGISTGGDYQAGYDAGYAACQSSCSSASSVEPTTCASFDFFSNSLHIPCFSSGSSSYWLDLKIINDNPVQLELTDFGQN